MGCVHSLQKRVPDMDQRGIPGTGDSEVPNEIFQLTRLTNTGGHVFTEKSFKRSRACDVCRLNIESHGTFCKVCKVTVHQKCETKVSTVCVSVSDAHDSIKSISQKKRGSLPRSRSVERVMEHVMEHHYDFDLTYITERIISVFFLPNLEEQRYRRNIQEVASMLRSKHQDKFLLLNLSEKRHDITRLNPKVQDYGWPDLHAPPLDRICAVCKDMETWLTSDPGNVVVLHCKGNKGKTGVIVAAYMHYSKISAGADQALTTLAMRKFCEDKVSSSLQPSQNRYIYYFGGLLSSTIKMNSSPLFLQQILIPSLPNFQTGGGYLPFLKIYQSLQLVYTSAMYDPQTSRARKLCVTVEPPLLLKGDIMVKCYHRRRQGPEREVVFRVQFHTCTVHGAQLWFGKTDLDLACTDDRFPPDATVEFTFSGSPEKIKGQEYARNDPSIRVDYNTSDPVVRWDSYENINLHHQDSMENIAHTRGPLDGSLYAQVRKRRGPGSTASGVSPMGCLSASPTVKPPAPSPPQPLGQPFSFSSDSGRSTASSNNNSRPEAPSAAPALSRREETEGGEARARGKARGREKGDRETSILDDEEEPSSPVALRRERSFCGQADGRCGGEWERGWERTPSQSNGHRPARCNSGKNNPKSRTLPALPVSPPTHPPHVELCHRHSAHPLPELPWERPAPPLPCLHRPCYPYSTPEVAHPHPHSLTLPGPARLCGGGEACRAFLFSGHGPSSHVSHQPLAHSPYRELFFSPTAMTAAAPSSGCPCPECAGRQELLRCPSAARAPRSGGVLRWSQETGTPPTGDGPPAWEDGAPWATEFWQREPPASQAYRVVCRSPPEQGPHPEQPGFLLLEPHQGHPSPGASSGYYTPLPPVGPQHSCPCSPYIASPAESRESRGYASGYQSEPTSPLPPTSSLPSSFSSSSSSGASAGAGRRPKPQHHAGQSAQAGMPDHISQRSVDESRSGSHLGTADVTDHDYTLISSNSSPTHTEDSAIESVAEAASQGIPRGQQEPGLGTSHNSTSTQTHTQEARRTTTATDLMHAPRGPSPSLTSVDRDKDTTAEGSATPSCTESPVSSVKMQLNGSALPGDSQSSDGGRGGLNPSPSHSSAPSSSYSPMGSPAGGSSPQASEKQRLSPDRWSTPDPKPPSPVPDGYQTPTFPKASYYLLSVPHVPYTGYTAITIPAVQPPLPEKKRLSASPVSPDGHNPTAATLLKASSSAPSPASPHHVTFSPTLGENPALSQRGSTQGSGREDPEIRVNAKFVQDSSKYWYKPGISRDQAIAVLKDKDPGAFLIRDSNSFQGAYGLALKVATPPANANITSNMGDPLEQLVRHFLIETGPRGVKIKGCQNESSFGSLSSLVYQHSITPISLPCLLRIPEKDLVGELQEVLSATSTSTAADLLRQGAACNVFYLNSVETESLTGPQAISKATKCTMLLSPGPTPTVVHFKVSTQGITLTDSKRRLFFRRHYPINSVTFSSVDPQDQRWTNSDSTSSKMFGFVARRAGSSSENVCHLFAEMDPEQPAVAIVNFINKVMLGPQLRR